MADDGEKCGVSGSGGGGCGGEGLAATAERVLSPGATRQQRSGVPEPTQLCSIFSF